MKTTLGLVLAIALLLTSSCGNYVYKRVSIRAPMLKEKNDINVQLNASNAGSDVYAAWAPINNLAISAAYTWRNDTFAGTDKSYHDIEFAAIPFYSKNYIRLEMPLGFAYFQQKEIATGQITQPYTRTFFQPTVAFVSDFADVALITRFTYIDYYNPSYQYDNRFEAGLLLRGGYKYVKFMTQFTVEDGTENSMLVDYYNFHVSFGLNITFNTGDFKKKPKTEPAVNP